MVLASNEKVASFNLWTGPPNPIKSMNFNAGFFRPSNIWVAFFSPLKMQEGVEHRRNMDLQQPVLLGEVLAKKNTKKPTINGGPFK